MSSQKATQDKEKESIETLDDFNLGKCSNCGPESDYDGEDSDVFTFEWYAWAGVIVGVCLVFCGIPLLICYIMKLRAGVIIEERRSDPLTAAVSKLEN